MPNIDSVIEHINKNKKRIIRVKKQIIFRNQK